MDPAPARPQVPVWDDRALAAPHAQADKATRIRRMFDAIAPAYQRVNTVSSLGRDRYWRRRAVALAGVVPGDRVLDIACGTGDLARAFAGTPAGTVIGADFAADMLRLAAAQATPRARWCQADALRLPFGDASFDVTSCAFGVRNFQDLATGLGEMHRVLRPGGRAVILEFSMPRGRIMRGLYGFYLRSVLPRIAAVISRDWTGAFRYLARSIVTFADEAGLEAALRAAGFASVRRYRLTFGIVHVHVARKDACTGDTA